MFACDCLCDTLGMQEGNDGTLRVLHELGASLTCGLQPKGEPLAGFTPALAAASADQPHCLRLLDMLSGATAATLCCESERSTATATVGLGPVHAAAQCGGVRSLEVLVELQGESVLSSLDGKTGLLPLHYAARGGEASLPSLRWLLRRPSVQAQVNCGPAPLPVLLPPAPRSADQHAPASGGRRYLSHQNPVS